MGYIEDTIEAIKPIYEDNEKMVIGYMDWAYLEQKFPVNLNKEPYRISYSITYKGKAIYRSSPESLQDTLKIIEND